MIAAARSSSLVRKLLDMLVSPGEVFDEVLAAPPRIANWLVPTLLVTLSSLVLLAVANNQSGVGSVDPDVLESATARAQPGSADWQSVSAVATCVGAFACTFWSAFLLWVIGRAVLRTRFSFRKAVELVALTGVILALGAVVTALLIAALGDAASRPALSILTRHLPTTGRVFGALDTLNFFHLWATSVLAIGLSRLSGVPFRECAFWVFGYWVVARLALIVLS
jgi:hypothetical protein